VPASADTATSDHSDLHPGEEHGRPTVCEF